MLPGQVFLDAYVEFREAAARAGMLTLPTQAAELTPRLHWSRRDVPFFLPVEVADAPVAVVLCNEGRWLVECPFCKSGQFAAREDHRFFCTGCLNEAAGAKWLRVKWPPNADKIEETLRPRLTRDASWLPGESLSDLRAENKALGVAV